MGNGAQGLFLDAGQAAGNVAGGGLAFAHVAADGFGTVLHVVDDLEDLVAHFLGNGAAGQQMLAADELGGLAEDDGGPKVHQLVGHIADHAVGGHAAGGVGRAALDGHDDVVTMLETSTG